MKILAIDIGSGSTKVVFYENGSFLRFKEINAVAKLPNNSKLPPEDSEDLVKLNDSNYMIGSSALSLGAGLQYDTTTFSGLKSLAPIITKKYLDKFGRIDHIMFDISIAYLEKSAEFTSHIISELGLDSNSVSIIAQGIGCKLCLDKYGLNPFSKNPYTLRNYVGMDLGFNTIDVWHVSNGKISSALVEGKEHTGVVRIADELKEFCSKTTDFSITNIKEAITSRELSYRGVPIEGFKEELDRCVKKYNDYVINMIETEYKDAIQVVDGIFICGGGASLILPYLKETEMYKNGFIIVPEYAEYYNAVGLIVYALKKFNLE